MLALPQIPAVPTDRLPEGNLAYVAVAPANATMEHLILAFVEFAIEPSDRQHMRTELINGKVRQGTQRAEAFFQDKFDPAVHIAQLEDSQYCDTLLPSLNDGINKKMRNNHILSCM